MTSCDKINKASKYECVFVLLISQPTHMLFGTQKNHCNVMQVWKILQFLRILHLTPYVFVYSITNIGNSQNFYLSYSIRHSPWRADFFSPVMTHLGTQNMFLQMVKRKIIITTLHSSLSEPIHKINSNFLV